MALGDLSEHDPTRSHAVAHDAALKGFLAEWWRSKAAEGPLRDATPTPLRVAFQMRVKT